MKRLSLAGMAGLVLIAAGCTSPLQLPIAAFTFAPLSGTSPLSVAFDASASVSADAAIVEYAWDFGDGSTGLGMTAGHVFRTDVGACFVVTLRITDHLGRQATTEAELCVSPPAVSPEDDVAFVWPFHYNATGDDAANLNDEYFTLQNQGDHPVDLSSWSVENERGVLFRFPAGTALAPGAVLTVHSGSGENSASIFYWNAFEPVWNDNSDIAILRDERGDIVDVYAYNSC